MMVVVPCLLLDANQHAPVCVAENSAEMYQRTRNDVEISSFSSMRAFKVRAVPDLLFIGVT
jgi:hypothetical protein